VDRQDRVALTFRPAVVDDLLRAAFDLGVATLHRVKVQLGRVGAGRHGLAALPPMPMLHAGAAQLDQQRACVKLDLLRLLAC
jgi:hypothetical protein